MSKRIIGLDIGTSAVRLAEIEDGATPTLKAFGQVALPPTAVVDGEIIEAPAVSEAIARLWSQLNIKKGAKVRVSVANPRLIVRPVELPAMNEEDLLGALRFGIADLIPMPIEEAVYDFRILEEIVSPSGEPQVRVLLAAAHRSSVEGILETVRAAGVHVSAIDPAPLALVRALDSHEHRSQLLVSIGAGITMVVVDDSGMPRFVRTVPLGGRSVDSSLAATLNVDQATAERMRIDGSVGMAGASAEDLALGRLIDTVRSSLEYHLSQPGAAVPSEVVVTGGMSRDHRLMDQLAATLGLPVRVGHPREHLKVADLGFSADDLDDVDAVLSVPLGLALGGLSSGRTINLGRDFIVEPITGARKGFLAAAAAALILVGGMGYLSYARTGDYDSADRDAKAVEDSNTTLNADIARLQPTQQLGTEISTRMTALTPILTGDLAWARVLEDLRASIPANVWIKSFTGTSTTAAATPDATSAETAALGSVSFEAGSFVFLDVRDWMRKIEVAPSLKDVWIGSITKGDSTTGTAQTQFSSTADLEDGAESCRLDAVDDPKKCP
ncbi:MAG: type IV pilus assembly protein PilM [Acidimicrobiia bacterium]